VAVVRDEPEEVDEHVRALRIQRAREHSVALPPRLQVDPRRTVTLRGGAFRRAVGAMVPK
jgi:hypothetical protein